MFLAPPPTQPPVSPPVLVGFKKACYEYEGFKFCKKTLFIRSWSDSDRLIEVLGQRGHRRLVQFAEPAVVKLLSGL